MFLPKSSARLNPVKKIPDVPVSSGLNKIAHNDGLNVKALNAEKVTDVAMATANC